MCYLHHNFNHFSCKFSFNDSFNLFCLFFLPVWQLGKLSLRASPFLWRCESAPSWHFLCIPGQRFRQKQKWGRKPGPISRTLQNFYSTRESEKRKDNVTSCMFSYNINKNYTLSLTDDCNRCNDTIFNSTDNMRSELQGKWGISTLENLQLLLLLLILIIVLQIDHCHKSTKHTN